MTELARTQAMPVSRPVGRAPLWKRLLRDRRSVSGAVLTGIVLLIVIVGPFVAPHGVDDYIGAPFVGPSADALLGTDFMGADVLSRVLFGGWTVLWMSTIAAAIGMVVGALVGLIAAYRGGWLDEVLMRVSDVFLSLPVIVFVLLFVSMVGRDHWLLVVLIGISWAPQVARVVRGAALDVAQREFVEHSRSLGSGVVQTVLTQILPNILTTLMVEFGLRMVWSIGALASLSVLGLGVSAPTADWGLMINENRIGLTTQPLAVLAPLVCIGFLALGVNLIAEGIARAQGIGASKE